MEEAYTALYQEFLRLQSLCLKQAAMLRHLTEALRRQQGLASDDSEITAVAGGIDRLQFDPMWGEVRQDSHDEATSVGFPRQQGSSEASITDELRQVEQHWHSSEAAKQQRRPWSSSFLNSELLSQAGGLLMSRVTLQSQVCEFCHAVFPGHTTTRGEFLRHLNTHVP
ncbi:uncharacterized protein zgc:113184 isoform X2 [Electrophorus electricus]|uniref:uncharacterized protein zgc:113184 isoform X2 n=1 Tax=Electrophorus electricus TaxID=8005 RepID=UPI000F0A7ECD|nr:uncharacterized protein zgc:113184 isoform X2 [Electrophorus electricus]